MGHRHTPLWRGVQAARRRDRPGSWQGGPVNTEAVKDALKGGAFSVLGVYLLVFGGGLLLMLPWQAYRLCQYLGWWQVVMGVCMSGGAALVATCCSFGAERVLGRLRRKTTGFTSELEE